MVGDLTYLLVTKIRGGLAFFSFLSVALGVFTGFAQASAARDSNRASREATNVSSANEQTRNARARRDQAKEARRRRAVIAQGAENSGTTGSSGALGALSATTSSSESSIADQKANILAVDGINSNLQRSANARSRAERVGIFGKTASSVVLELGERQG